MIATLLVLGYINGVIIPAAVLVGMFSWDPLKVFSPYGAIGITVVGLGLLPGIAYMGICHRKRRKSSKNSRIDVGCTPNSDVLHRLVDSRGSLPLHLGTNRKEKEMATSIGGQKRGLSTETENLLVTIVSSVLWFALYAILFLRGENATELLRWAIGGLILSLIVVFYSVILEEPYPMLRYQHESESVRARVLEDVFLIGIVLLLGALASWLATTPGWARIIGMFLIAVENIIMLIALNGGLNWDTSWKSKASLLAFLPIIFFGFLGIREVILQGC